MTRRAGRGWFVPLAALLLPIVLSGLHAEAPRPLAPVPAPARTTPAEDPSGNIRTEPLPEPSLATLGLEHPVFGFDQALWRDADGARLRALIAALEGLPPVPELRQLARRLLVAPGPAVADGRALLEARARALLRLGFARDAADLLALAAERQEGARDLRLELEALLRAGRFDRACTAARHLRDRPAERSALRAACLRFEGRLAQARLQLDLAIERDLRLDDAAAAFLRAVADGAPVPLPPVGSPARLAGLLAAAAFPVAMERIEGEIALDGALLAALARNSGLAPERRLEAAERALLRGMISLGELRELYLELGSGAKTVEKPGPARTRARLFAALHAEKDVAARAGLLVEAMKAQPAGIERYLWLRLLASEAEAIPSDPALLWAFEPVSLALAAAGKRERLRRWLALAGAQRKEEPERAQARARVAALEQLLDGRVAESQPGRPARLGEYALALRLGLGLEVPTGELAAAIAWPTGRPAPPPRLALWWLAREGEAAERPGEALLATLALLGPDIESISPPLLVETLLRLRRFGEVEAARSLAMAVALALRL